MSVQRKELAAALLLGAGAALLVWSTGSPHYDDGDAALFVAGVERFDPTQNRPHSPGYPVYILLGKLATWLTGDPFQGLRLLSALATGLAVAMLPALFRSIGLARRPAWALASLTTVLPCFWLTGAKVLTDMPGFAAYLACAIVLLRRPEAGLGAGFLAGLLAGIRPHFLLALAPLLLGRRPLARVAGLVIGAGVWIAGTATVIGASAAMSSASRQIGMRFERPGVSLFSPGEQVGPRLKHHAYELMHDALGVTPLPTRLIAGAILLWTLWTVLRAPRLAAARGLVVGAVIYGVFVFAYLPADPRYVLVAAPALVLLGTRGDWRVAAALALAVLPATIGRAALLRVQPPPVQVAIEWMAECDPGRQVPYVSSLLFAHARVLDPERVGPPVRQAVDVPSEFFVARRDFEWLGLGPLVEIVDARVFERDPVAHQKSHRVQLLRCHRIESR